MFPKNKEQCSWDMTPWVMYLQCYSENRVWNPNTHLNAGWVGWLAYNTNAQEAETGHPRPCWPARLGEPMDSGSKQVETLLYHMCVRESGIYREDCINSWPPHA